MADNAYDHARRREGWRYLDRLGSEFQQELYDAKRDYGLDFEDLLDWGIGFAEDMGWVSSSYEC